MTPEDSSRQDSGRGSAGRAKDDIHSAPESGEKPEALQNGRNASTGSGASSPAKVSRDRDAQQGTPKDDVSKAPESGDKPEAM